MRLISESTQSNQNLLIVSSKKTNFVKYLKQVLETYSINVFYTPFLPKNINNFDYVFILNNAYKLKQLLNTKVKYVLFYIGKLKKAQSIASEIINKNIKNIKVVNSAYEVHVGVDLEKLLWFVFSSHTDAFINLRTARPKETFSKVGPFNIKKYLIIFLILFYLLCIPLFLTSSYFLYRSGKAIRVNEFPKAQVLMSYANVSQKIGSGVYKITRPVYLLFSIATLPDSISETNIKINTILQKSIDISINGNGFIKALFEKNKTDDQIRVQVLRIDKLEADINTLLTELTFIQKKISGNLFLLKNFKVEIEDLINEVAKAKTIMPNIKSVLGEDIEKKYLLLFANNMELRPGGGFIGSFGILTIRDLTIQDLKIYDVYDADGQLKEHVNPPAPIRKYLGQPNWFLRDSAFSSDFYENYTQAKKFLDLEINSGNFDGGILVTTSAIQNILESMNEIYIPDFNEKINKDNFYIKAQLYAEENFFPGSTQKKGFLAALTRQMFIELENASFPVLFKMLNKSLDEKHITLLFDDKNIQSSYDSLYWSGKRIAPSCYSKTENCAVDYIFTFDANLGVNKANFFVTKNMNLKVTMTKDGSLNNELTIFLNNESQNNTFPGGDYKNYMQISLPKRAIIKQLTKNGVLIEKRDESIDEYKTIGFLVEIPAQKSTEIKLKYSLQSVLSDGDGIYQLIFQKQIGSLNSDLSIQIFTPENITIQDQNFNPVVKDNSFLYNTTLSSDKILIIKLKKN